MSIVLVKKNKDKIIIGADSQETSGDSNQENINNCKLKKINDYVYIGGSGNAHICSLLYAYASNSIETFEQLDNSHSVILFFKEFSDWIREIVEPTVDGMPILATAQFLIIIKDRVWLFNNYYIREVLENEYSAIGSGIQGALACFNLTDDIEKILKAVCKADIYCSEPITIREIPINGHK